MGETLEEARAIACGELPLDFVEAVRAATGLPGCAMHLLPGVMRADDLISTVASQRPRFVLVPGNWLRQETLGLLTELGAAHRDAIAVVVGHELSSLALAEALRRGLRGVFEPTAGSGLLRRALDALHGGELWISRRTILEMLARVTPPDAPGANETWRNLPALTAREHAVLQQILEGQSNKQIARSLELSENTVKIHLQHIYQKLGVHRRLDLLKARA